MTVDIEKLKALALAATPGSRRWWPARDGDHDYAQIAAGREHIAQVRIRSITEADINLFLATDPAAVLELIAEVERLRAEVERLNDGMEIAINGLQNIAAVEARAAPAGGTVNQPKLANGHREDYYLLANARRLGLMPIHQVVRMPNWVLASDLFATGSNSAHQICVDAGIDPDGLTVTRAAIEAHTKAGKD